MDEKVLCRTIDCHFGASYLESSGNAYGVFMECSLVFSAMATARDGEGRPIRHAVLAMLRWTLDKNRSSGHRLLIAGRSGKTCRICKLIRFPCVPRLVNVSISSASQWSQGQFSFTPYQFSWGCTFPSCQIVIKKHQVRAQVIASNIKPINQRDMQRPSP